MIYLVYILKISFQIFFLLCLFFLYLQGEQYSVNKEYSIHIFPKRNIRLNIRRNIGIGWGLLFCFLEIIYTFICSEKGVFIADRLFYAKRFSLGIFTKESSLGLYYIQKFLSLFTNNPYALFVTVAVLYIILTIKACNSYDDYSRYVLLFIGSSQYLIYGTYQLKQVISNSIVAIAVALLLKYKKRSAFLLVALAILFHEVAIIAIPIFLLLCIKNNRFIRSIAYIILLVSVFQFPNISRLLIALISYIWPGFSGQINLYTNDSGAFDSAGGLLQVVKGIPFYIIPILGYVYRKQLIDKLEHYHEYMFISIFASVCMILQTYMTWMWRFTELFLLPVFIFAGQIAKNMNKKNRLLFLVSEILMLLVITIRKLFICYFSYGGII